MKEALLSASAARTDHEEVKAVLDPKHFGIRMLFIDLVLVKAKDVTDALARNLARTEIEGRLWPLYVDPQTYAMLLRCILYGESVADQGYTWREVFAHYRPVIEQHPQLGMFKPEHEPVPRKHQSDITIAELDSSWYHEAIVKLREHFVDDLNAVKAHSVMVSPSVTTLPKSTVVPKPDPVMVTKPTTTVTMTKTKSATRGKASMPKEELEKIALSNRIDCRHTRNQIAIGTAEDLVEQSDAQLEWSFLPLLESDHGELEIECDSQDNSDEEIECAMATNSDLKNVDISHAALDAIYAAGESSESQTQRTMSPVRIVVHTQTREMIMEDGSDTDDDGVANCSNPMEEGHPVSDYVSSASSKGAKSTINTRNRKRTDTEYSNLSSAPPMLRPRTRATERSATTNERLSNGKKK